jgi:hypothetical protein
VSPSNGVTEDKVKLMIVDGLKEYERTVVEPRHKETQLELGAIKALVQQGSGALKLGGFALSLGSFVWIVLQILHHVGK